MRNEKKGVVKGDFALLVYEGQRVYKGKAEVSLRILERLRKMVEYCSMITQKIEGRWNIAYLSGNIL